MQPWSECTVTPFGFPLRHIAIIKASATNAESLYNLYDAVAEVLYCGTMYQLWLQTNLPMVPGLDRWQQVLSDRSSNFFEVEELKLK